MANIPIPSEKKKSVEKLSKMVWVAPVQLRGSPRTRQQHPAPVSAYLRTYETHALKEARA